MLRKWATRRSLLDKHLTTAQVQQSELNKSEVERMCVQLEILLDQLQTACLATWDSWSSFIFNIDLVVENNRRGQSNSSLRHPQMKGMLYSLKNL